jgi:hypothetical protein
METYKYLCDKLNKKIKAGSPTIRAFKEELVHSFVEED